MFPGEIVARKKKTTLKCRKTRVHKMDHCGYVLCRCSTGADRLVTIHFWRVGTNVYKVD